MKLLRGKSASATTTPQDPELKSLVIQVNTLQQSVESQARTLEAVLKQLETQTRLMDGMRNAALHPLRAEMYEAMKTRQLSMFGTLDAVRNEKLSLARFGDGELRLALYDDFDIRFQPNSLDLRNELLSVLEDRSLPLLVTFPEPSRDRFWTDFWTNHWHRLKYLIDLQPRLGHTQVTRREFFGVHGQDAVDAWRSVWSGRDAVLVAGKGSRFEMIDALFGSLNSVQRLDAPATNAYAQIDAIEREIVACAPDLVLLALGPAGTLLACRLARRGIQALDIGHITAVWQQVFEGADSPESRPTVA